MSNQPAAQQASPHPEPLPLLTRVAAGFLLLIAAWLVVLGLFNLHHPSDWAMGDWLINYTGGFVRRGLIGELALGLRHLLRLPILWSVLLLQWAFYAVILLGTWQLIRGRRWTWWTAAMVFSPATLAFVLQDPAFAFRKEILLFALVLFALWAARPEAESTAKQRIGFSLLLAAGCAVCLLAHEGLLVFFPYLFAAVSLRTRCWRQAAVLFAPAAGVSLAVFALASHFPGNPAVAQAVCSSIGGQLTQPPSGICGGAIDYLIHDAAYAHHEVRRTLLDHVSFLQLPLLFVLPFLPAALGIAQMRRTNRFAFNILLPCTGVAAVLSISVFYYGTDWTRWIYIHCFTLMLLLLFAQGQAKRTGAGTPEPSSLLSLHRAGGWALLLLYCLGWQLTVYRPRPLYGSFARYVTHTMRHPG